MSASTADDGWARWRDTIHGAVIEPGDERFEGASRPWNLTVAQRPAVVVVAEDVEDVVAAVGLAAQQGRSVAVQSTGHGASDSLEGAVLLRTGGLRGVAVDAARRRARVAPGAVWREVQQACSPHGLSGLLGTAPGVGATGYTLGGGVGLLGRAHGPAAHRLVAAEIVTGDGHRRRVDEEHDPDLLWALRGGGTPPGVVTQLEIELVAVPVLSAGQFIWPVEAAPDLFGAFRAWTATVPEELTSILGVRQIPPFPHIPEPLRGRRVVALTAAYLGSEAEARELLRPLTDLTRPLSDTFGPRAVDDLDVAGVPADPEPAYTGTELLTDLPDAALPTLVDLGAQPGPLMMIELRHLGGALARSAQRPAALERVEGEFMLEMLGIVLGEGDPGVIREEQERVRAAVADVSTGRTLRTFAQRDDRAPQRFFAPDVVARLADVARRYDPDAVVHDPIGVRTAARRSL
jgi:hypothetical protein